MIPSVQREVLLKRADHHFEELPSIATLDVLGGDAGDEVIQH